MASVASPRRARPPLQATLSRIERRSVTEWYVAGALIAFTVPLIGAGVLELHHDLYLLDYFTVAGTFLASFVAHTGLDWRGWLRTRLWWSVAVGGVVALAMVGLLITGNITLIFHVVVGPTAAFVVGGLVLLVVTGLLLVVPMLIHPRRDS